MQQLYFLKNLEITDDGLVNFSIQAPGQLVGMLRENSWQIENMIENCTAVFIMDVANNPATPELTRKQAAKAINEYSEAILNGLNEGAI